VRSIQVTMAIRSCSRVSHRGDQTALAPVYDVASILPYNPERITHANGYPNTVRVTDFHPKDYPGHKPLVPHGMSVALIAPEAFRFTFEAAPDRHVRAAELLAPPPTCNRISLRLAS
jgi:hypothetical protein